MLDRLDPEKWVGYNAKLQQKKSALRKELSERGILKREGSNTYDKYKYFSEAQYKALFTELFSKHGLELSFNEVEYGMFTVEGKQPNGRTPKIEFKLHDTETGFYETTTITGEGIDKGDKAGYKAYTGALKYYLADTFMVATGDDPETESPEGRSYRPPKKAQNNAQNEDPLIDAKQAEQIAGLANSKGISVDELCKRAHIKNLNEMRMSTWVSATRWLNGVTEGGAA